MLPSEFERAVLVIGGGPAGMWAALTAASQGAGVVLADKGFHSGSDATAAAGTGIWYVLPEPARRRKAMASCDSLDGHLADPARMTRVLYRTWDGVNQLADWGYFHTLRPLLAPLGRSRVK